MSEEVSMIKYLDSKFDEVHRRLDVQDSELVGIRAQTTKTNGRVTALEVWKEKYQEIIDTTLEIKKDRVKRTRDLIWQVAGVLTICLVLYIMGKVGLGQIFK